jgi:TRAP-type mannitol/chloroaromatic compound transport system permease large subunit
MIFWIIISAQLFTSVYIGLGAADLVKEVLLTLPLGPWGIIILMQLSLFVLGCFMDTLGIIMITTPLYVPVIIALGFNPLWFGITFTVNMEMAYLTPPFGGNLFYLKGVVPPGITMGDIYRSIVPFVGLQAIGLALIMAYPQIALLLPELILGAR